ncbi:MAG TPA: TnsA-like heteromeric transposase endonuclease subunit, partial [Nitrolancea sp.]|nr:TnsA-like heteromeric transposase endonuclease subunit [Nitrolancea sp.]
MAAQQAWSLAQPSGFDLGFVTADGTRHRGRLTECWAQPFEQGQPARKFPSYKGQKNFTGWRWVATTGRHVGFESWLERDHLTLLDYDPALTAICSQPFTVFWREGRRERMHTPDYFARAVDGSALVLDVKSQAQITQRDAVAFAAIARVCGEVGWRYERVGELDPVYRANMRWLAAYRHPRFGESPLLQRVRACFAQPTPLFAGAQAAGDRITILPLVYHLLWRQMLRADLRAQRLNPMTLVWDAHAVDGGGSRSPATREQQPEAGAMPALRVPDLSDRPQPEGALMTDAARVLRVEDHVRFEGRTWRVAALAGAAVTLADHEGRRKQLWLTELYLHGSPVHPDKRPRHVPSGTLKLLKEPVLKQARWWETHILEVITGVPPGAPPDTAPRPEYDPSTRTLAEREQAKSAELRRAGHGRGASAASVKVKRLRYQARGLEGLVDGHSDPDRERAVDPRYVAALRQLIKEAKDESTRNAKFFRWKTELRLTELYGRGAVPLPSRATFYRLFDELTVGRHTTGSARTRRSVAVQPPAPFGVYSVTRPGELMEIDSTPLDIAVRLPRGVVGRVELTAIIDVGSRSVPAAVLRPTTKAVDASLLVARTVTPELMR